MRAITPARRSILAQRPIAPCNAGTSSHPFTSEPSRPALQPIARSTATATSDYNAYPTIVIYDCGREISDGAPR